MTLLHAIKANVIAAQDILITILGLDTKDVTVSRIKLYELIQCYITADIDHDKAATLAKLYAE